MPLLSSVITKLLQKAPMLVIWINAIYFRKVLENVYSGPEYCVHDDSYAKLLCAANYPFILDVESVNLQCYSLQRSLTRKFMQRKIPGTHFSSRAIICIAQIALHSVPPEPSLALMVPGAG